MCTQDASSDREADPDKRGTTTLRVRIFKCIVSASYGRRPAYKKYSASGRALRKAMGPEAILADYIMPISDFIALRSGGGEKCNPYTVTNSVRLPRSRRGLPGIARFLQLKQVAWYAKNRTNSSAIKTLTTVLPHSMEGDMWRFTANAPPTPASIDSTRKRRGNHQVIGIPLKLSGAVWSKGGIIWANEI